MNRRALVLKVEKGRAYVSPVDVSDCEGCEAGNACRSFSGKNRKPRPFWVLDDIGVSEGDVVDVELKPSVSLTIISVTFLVPVLMLFAGYLFTLGGSTLEVASGSGIGLLAGILFSVLVNRRLAYGKGFGMRVTNVVKKGGDG